MVMNFKKSVNIVKFIEFLEEIRLLHPDESLAIFMDRLSVHKSNRVQYKMAELGIVRILNASY